jgi:hypothetical protein
VSRAKRISSRGYRWRAQNDSSRYGCLKDRELTIRHAERDSVVAHNRRGLRVAYKNPSPSQPTRLFMKHSLPKKSEKNVLPCLWELLKTA